MNQIRQILVLLTLLGPSLCHADERFEKTKSKLPAKASGTWPTFLSQSLSTPAWWVHRWIFESDPRYERGSFRMGSPRRKNDPKRSRMRYKLSGPFLGDLKAMTADQFEGNLMAYLGMNGTQVISHSVFVHDRLYKFTMTNDVYHGLAYFRAGSVFVLTPLCVSKASNPNQEKKFRQLLNSYAKIVWLSESVEGQAFYLYRDSFGSDWKMPGAGYMLPAAIGILIALQHIERNLQSIPILDIGARNGMYAAAAMQLGAASGMAVEKNREEIYILPGHAIYFQIAEGIADLLDQTYA